MTTVCEKGKCTGCMECIDVCPKKAIKVIDSWMEYNAVIDSEKCIQCMHAIVHAKTTQNKY